MSLCLCVVAGAAAGAIDTPQPETAPRYTGSEFARHIAGMDAPRREQAILAAILSGNLPPFLRTLVPIALDYHAPGGKTVSGPSSSCPNTSRLARTRTFFACR